MPNQLMRLLRDNAQARARLPLKAEVSGDEATLYLYDVIVSDDYWGGIGAESFVKELLSITAPVIHIRINSPGGEVFAARAIEAAIREHKSKCIAHVDGCAASAASFVAIACDEVEISAGALFMIHRAWCLEAGNCEDFTKTAAWLEKVDGTLAATYASETGLELPEIIRMMSDETWMTAQESVDLGFADRIAEPAAKAQAGWNLSAYSRAPKPHAQAQDDVPAPVTDNPETEQADNAESAASETVSNRDRYERLSRLHGSPQPDSRAA
ncbi:MAG: peptidase S14 [Desulfovibrionaceae bacterium CG1_02_65_16]|nr:MAG: peptidase S14 [Desulfovibrionaceae bacterium CG1_02_65_16]